jgi:hypothetical protein
MTDSPIMQIQLSIAAQLGKRSKGQSGFYNMAQCPYCGAARKAAIKPGRGFKCFVCETKLATLDEWQDLAARLSTPLQIVTKEDDKPERKKAMLWQDDPGLWQSRLTSHPDLISAWSAYKPVTPESIMRYQLGYGVMPPVSRGVYTCGCDHLRLTYANIENIDGKPMAFRGRATTCTCSQKWLTIAGASAWLWNSHNLRQARDRWVVQTENPIDAILLMQAYPDVYAVAGTAGASTWHEAWSHQIAAASPLGFISALDNDLIGNPTPQTRAMLLALWTMKMVMRGNPPTPQMIEQQRTKAMGIKVAASVKAAGVARSRCYTWAEGTKPKQDIGQHLIDRGLV